MSVFRWIFAVLVVGLVAFATWRSLQPHVAPPTEAQVAEVKKSSITRSVSGAGKLEPLTKVNVSSNITGILVDLKVGIGSEVKKGQYLGQIDTSRYKAQVEQQRAGATSAAAQVDRQQAELARLRRELQRVEQLNRDHAASASELEAARSAVSVAEATLAATRGQSDMARAGLREVSNNLEWATLKAPVDGTVLAVNHRVGERIRGSDFTEDVVLILGTLHRMDVRIEVGEHDVVHIKPGQKAKIEIDAIPDVPLEGDVLETGRDAIVRFAGTDNEVTTYPVWVSLDKPPAQALSGMSAQVTIETETRADTVGVPIQAVTVRPGSEGKLEKVVFVVKDGKAQKRGIQTGISSDTMVEITGGLQPGEKVVEGPYRLLARELQDGATITEQQPPPQGQEKPPATTQAKAP
jgi:HlyD family secretion protein